MSNEIIIYIPKYILEDKALNSLEKLLHSITYSLSRSGKLGFNSYTNKELGELLSVDVNSLGKHRKKLVELGYERKEKGGKFYLVKKTATRFNGTILPSQVYSLKLSSGAKLLWSLYNSLEKGTLGYCKAKRETLAKRLNCSVESITSWSEQLNERELFTHYELLSGKNSRQRIIKTKRFNKEELVITGISQKEEETSLENVKTVNTTKKSIAQEKLASIVSKSVIAVDGKSEDVVWSKYMKGVDELLLNDYNQVQDFLWNITKQIEEDGEDASEVFIALYEIVDTKLKKKEHLESFKKQLLIYSHH